MNISNTVKAIIILQIDGKRMIAKYFDESLNTSAKQFEKRLFAKTKTPKAKDEIIVLDGVLVVHRFVTDSHYYIVGNRNENPMVLDSVLHCLVEVVSTISSENKSSKLDNLTKVILALDEICDGGLILETDSNLVLQRIASMNEDYVESIASKIGKRILGL